MKPSTPACAEHADRPKTELQPSTQLRKVVFGSSPLSVPSSQNRSRMAYYILSLAASALIDNACLGQGQPDIVWVQGDDHLRVNSVAFSPDGSFLASGGSGGVNSTSLQSIIRIHRVSDGALVRTLPGHDTEITSVAFSPQGATIASGSWDNTAKLWRESDGALLATLSGHSNIVTSVAFSPDGQILASASWDNTIKLWRVTDGTLSKTLVGHKSLVTSLAFSPDGNTLVSGSHDLTVKLWRMSDGVNIRTLSGHTSWILSVAFSPDGMMIASSSHQGDSSIKLWRASDGALLQTLTGHTFGVKSIVFSPDGNLLISGGRPVFDDTIRFWRIPDGKLLQLYAHEVLDVRSIAIERTGRFFAYGGDVVIGGEVLSRDVVLARNPFPSITAQPRSQKVKEGVTVTFDVSAEGPGPFNYQWYFTPPGRGRVSLSAATNAMLVLNNVRPSNAGEYKVIVSNEAGDWPSAVAVLEVSPAVVILSQTESVTVSSGANISLSVVADGDPPLNYEWRFNDQTIPGQNKATLNFTNVGKSDAGRYTVIVSNSAGSATGRVIELTVVVGLVWSNSAPPECCFGTGNFVAFSSDGSLLASGSGKTIKLWRVSDGFLLQNLTGHAERISSVIFSPTEAIMVSGSDDQTVKLWHVPDGTLLKTLNANSGVVTSIAISPDGSTLASGHWGFTGTITLYRVSDWTLLKISIGHPQGVTCIAFSPDGKTLASGGNLNDHTIKFWRVSDGTLLRTITEDFGIEVTSVAFSPDGGTLVASVVPLAQKEAAVQFWRVSDGSLSRELKVTGKRVVRVPIAISPERTMLAAPSRDVDGSVERVSISLWRMSGGSLIKAFGQEAFGAVSFAFSPSGLHFAIGRQDGMVLLLRTPFAIDPVSRPPNGTFQLTFESTLGGDYTIQTSANLVDWRALTNIIATSSMMKFTDENASRADHKFYRAFLR